MDQASKSVSEVGSVEVVYAWRDDAGQRSVIDAELVDGEQVPALWIGAQQGQRFMLPHEAASLLGPAARFCLVRREEGRFVLDLPEAATVLVAKDGVPVELGSSVERIRTLVLSADHVCEVQLGAFSFYIKPGAAPERSIDRGPLFDMRAARWGLAAFAAHAVFVGMFFFVPPNASALNLDLGDSQRRYIQVELAAMEAEEEERLLEEQANAPQGHEVSEPDEAAGAGNETPEVHISGGPGRREGASRRSDRPAPAVTRDNIMSMGTLAALSGGLADMAGDSRFAFGNPDMVDGLGGPGYEQLIGGVGIGGFGGLNMNGTGRGTCVGPDCGQGTVAQGSLSATCDAECQAAAFSHGNTMTGTMGRTSRVPRIRDIGTTTSGGLSREDIRRTIRRHINEVRFCYEQELSSRPDLEGRVSVRFMVNADGSVGSSVVADQSGPVADVGSCVSASVRRWTFPSSEMPTIVTYPFLLQSAQ